MADVLQFLGALDASAKTTAADLNAVTVAASTAAAASARSGGAGGGGGAGAQGGLDPASRAGANLNAGRTGGFGVKLLSTTVSGATPGQHSLGGAADLIAELKSLQGRGSGTSQRGAG